MNFNLLALIKAGLVTEHDNNLAIIQNIEPETAHAICRWLVLATGQPAHLRLIGPGQIEDIRYTPDEVRQLTNKEAEL